MCAARAYDTVPAFGISLAVGDRKMDGCLAVSTVVRRERSYEFILAGTEDSAGVRIALTDVPKVIYVCSNRIVQDPVNIASGRKIAIAVICSRCPTKFHGTLVRVDTYLHAAKFNHQRDLAAARW